MVSKSLPTYCSLIGLWLRSVLSTVFLVSFEGRIVFSFYLALENLALQFGASGEQIKKDLEEGGIAIPCVQSKGLMEAIKTAEGFALKGVMLQLLR